MPNAEDSDMPVKHVYRYPKPAKPSPALIRKTVVPIMPEKQPGKRDRY
jgi:hypothetical protein